MVLRSDGTIRSKDGLSLFHQSWVPDGETRAAVMLLHGLGEHSGRYDHVADVLVDLGCAVYAIDHRGHGKSEGPRCFVRSYDEFMADIDLFRRSVVEAAQPDVPLFVLGHSMGGNLALGHVLLHQSGVAGLALSAPLLKVGDDISPMTARIVKVLGKVAPKIRPEALSAESISRDPAVVKAYEQDPLVFHGKVSAGLGGALFSSIDTFPSRIGQLKLPVLLLHGTDDKLVDIAGSQEFVLGANAADVTVHYYDGLYHEVFNEPEQDQVLNDTRNWFSHQLSG